LYEARLGEAEQNERDRDKMERRLQNASQRGISVRGSESTERGNEYRKTKLIDQGVGEREKEISDGG